MRRTLALTLALALSGAPLALAHDFYHDEYWDEDYTDCHEHGPYVSPSKLDMAWELYETGRHLANCHSLEESVKPIKQAIDLEPRVARFHLSLGMILRDQGKKDEAVTELKLARKYGYGWVEEEAYWTLKDLGADPRYDGDSTATSPAGTKSLYDRLGGHAAIVAVVDSFVARVAKDARINAFFAKTDIPTFKQKLVEQIGSATGGPETYTGRTMKATHENMGVKDSDFDALVGDLAATLQEFKVPAAEQNELLSALSPMRKDIVELPGK